MARTALTPTTIAIDGTDLTAVDTAAELTDGNSFPWNQHRLLYVANGDDSDLTVTVATPGTIGRGSLAISDLTITVGAGKAKVAGPFGAEFRQSDGSVHVDYSGADASVTVAVLDA